MSMDSHKRVLVTIWGLTGALLLGLSAAVAGLLWNARQDALAEGEARVTRFAAGAEAGMNRSLLSLDMFLASLAELLDRGEGSALDTGEAAALLRAMARQNLMLRDVALLDEQGRPLASSAQGQEPPVVELPKGLVAAALAPVVPTLTLARSPARAPGGEQVLYVARPLRLADGTRLLAVAQVPVDVLLSVLLQGVSLPEMEVTLERTQGELLVGMLSPQAVAERPGTAVPSLQAMGAQGHFTGFWQQARTRLSGQPALVAARPLLYPDLWITASLPQARALADWRHEAVAVGGGALLFGACLVLAGVFASLYLRRMQRARESVASAKATLDQAVGSMVSGFVLLDAARRIVQWNRPFEEMFPWLVGTVAVGLPYRRVLETTVHYHLPAASAQEKRDWVERRLLQQRDPQGTHEQSLPNGHFVQITERTTPTGGLVILYHDVTDLRLAAAEIEQLAFYDQLTGLSNRRLLLDRLSQACASAVRADARGAVLFIDLDQFKTLNDTLGHETGDQLLQQVARRLQGCVRASDTVARLGGDEFVVLLAGLPADATDAALLAHAVADKILRLLGQPYLIEGQTYHGSCSIGASLFGQLPQTAGELLRQADIAMYQAKAQRGNALCFFEPSMQTAINERARLEADLQQALGAGQFLLHLQPQFDGAGAMVGAEALLRWQHPVHGLVPPARFIAVAEDSELIVPIGRWVLHSACELLARWHHEPHLRHMSLSVNVSARQFRQGDFADLVAGVLRDTGAPAQRLELELTESLVLEHVDDSIAKMHQLRAKGVRFAVDDFGTGYSSLSYLTRLPLQRLKIDKSFVHHLNEQHGDDVVVQTILGMARNLELEVVAEGVETEAQRDFLARHGCDLYQGYLFARPMPVAELEAMLLPLAQ
ncbi:MAG: EAL domain-containing protein [Proteobacteria bacterium]|nr:EAL domain-containing protein [Pseudomonadota bacterium]